MRAIDADELKKCVLKWLPQDPCGREEKEMPFETDICVSMLMEIDEQPTITPESHWIPVTENTLPDKNRVVVVCGEKGTWDYGMYRGYCNSNIHLWEWKKKTLKWVYWWMYKEDALPEPYKGVTE